MLKAFKDIYKADGIIGFYKGLTASLIGVTHVAIQFPLYEYWKRKIGIRFIYVFVRRR